MAERMMKAEKRIIGAYSRFAIVGVVVGIVALLATIASVVIVLRSEKTEVAAQVMASDELTTYHPELKASFTYAGEEVTYLWKLRVKFVNSGDKTLIGVGDIRNILGDGLNFLLPDETRILRVEEEADTFDGSIVQTNANSFQIQFSQWRSGEYMIGCFYIASDEPLRVDPFPSVPGRDIADGDVRIQDLTERRPEERMLMIDRLPGSIATPGKIMGGILAGVLTIVMIIMVSWGWKDSLPLIKWKSRHFSSFVKYLDQVEPPLSDEQKRRLKKDPEKESEVSLPQGFWDKFEDPKVPTKTPMFDSVATGIATTLVFLLMAFGFISLILVLIPA